MKNYKVYIFLLCFSTIKVFAQQSVTERLINLTDTKLNATQTTAILDLQNTSAALQGKISLKQVNSKNGLLGKHITYQQYVNNIPVYGAQLKVNTNAGGEIISSFSSLINVEDYTIESSEQLPNAVWVVQGNVLKQVSKTQTDYLMQLKDKNGNVEFEKETRLFFTDTTVKARVFNPDPLTTAGVTYGTDGTYRHFNDSDYALLNDQRVWVTFPAQYDNGTFYLQNNHVKIVDITAPNIAPETTTTDTFLFTRKQGGFKQVMAIYHIHALQEFLKSLGISNAANYQLRVDANSGTGDQSFFTFSPDTSLNFGTGGVPDAEDADVIVHEYTHAIIHSLNGDDIIATERRALEEAICDVMACAYSFRINPFRWKRVFSWDGNNEFWQGRNGASAKDYTQRVGDFYSDSEIWTSCLNNVTERIGADKSIKLLVSIMPMLTPYTTMKEAAHLLYDADSILNNGFNRWVLAEEFNLRGFDTFPTGINEFTVTNDFFKVINSAAFAQGNGNLSIKGNTIIPLQVEIFDASGKLVHTFADMQQITISPEKFSSGLFICKVVQGNNIGYIKLLKL